MAVKRALLKKTTPRSRGSQIPDYTINQWLGLVTSIKNSKELQKGAASDGLNWLTGKEKDHIELRRGYTLLGTTRVAGSGQVTGLGIGYGANQSQVPFYTYGRALAYYNAAAADVQVINATQLPTAAATDAVSIQPYNNLAGFFVYVSSPNSSAYKIPVANPTSVIDLVQNTFKGNFVIKQNRTFLFNKLASSQTNQGGLSWDKTGLYLSYVDKAAYSSYTLTSAESVGTGDGVTKTFNHTLAAVTGVKTCFAIQATDTNETFTDDLNGNMVGTLGGTGTINYATGVMVLNFNTAPANLQAITVKYYTEDSTSAGVWDFSYSPSRTAGQGDSFRQDDGGGNLNGVGLLNGINFCLHQYKTWSLSITNNDVNADNEVYRDKVGIPSLRAFDESGVGIPYLNYADITAPYVEQLEVVLGATNQVSIVPKTLSAALDLTNQGFDAPVVKDWSDYIILVCQSKNNAGKNNANNDTMFVLNKLSGQWDKVGMYASVLESYNGTLLAGDSISNNLFQLFTGFVDDGAIIPNFWTSSEMNCDVAGSKRFYRVVVDGLIGVNQSIQFWASFDNGPFILLYTQNGSDTNVDFNSPLTIGSTMVGTKPIGDGSPSGGATNAYHYRKEVQFGSPIFEWIKVKVVATNIGWAQVNEITLKDIRYKGRRVAPKYLG